MKNYLNNHLLMNLQKKGRRFYMQSSIFIIIIPQKHKYFYNVNNIYIFVFMNNKIIKIYLQILFKKYPKLGTNTSNTA